MIQISNLTKRYHSLVALRDVTIRIQHGEVLGVLGPNGAGKTTLFKLIAGFLLPDEGHIGATSSAWPTIGYKPERLLFPNHLRVRQYLQMVAELSNVSGQKSRQLVGASLERVALGYAAEKRIKDCSKGMRQRLGLAQAMIGDPPLLLLDEPSNGLDPEGQADICRQIKALHASGKTIVLASHQLHEVTQVCTHLIILNEGAIHYENRMADALTIRPHTSISVAKDLGPLRNLLLGLSSDLEVHEQEVILSNEAMALRPQVLRILLAAGYDITEVDQSRVTLAEIYAEAVR
ncbi:MAG: ABC transporter ATP-binding protein [Chloroflexota bacterium]|nr:MAG: ABC transporter ATP-binding protein [Chloroflexota bacterium]